MKTNKTKRASVWRIFLQRSATAHDPWFILNMELFNFPGGRSQVFSRQRTRQFSR